MNLPRDSVENYRSRDTKPGRDGRGKLVKGTSSGHKSPPTIPSKYSTVITKQNEQLGFSKGSKRFQSTFSDTPGPGAYQAPSASESATSSRVQSKKGSGSFASSSGRQQIRLNNIPTPGAGAYQLAQVDVYKRKDFSQGPSSVFKPPIAVAVEKESPVPAPNVYDISNKSKFQYRANNVCADSAFRSKTKRETELAARSTGPAPGAYEIAGDTVSANSVAYASFKSTSQRRSFTPKGNMPGPGDYHPNEPLTETVNRKLFPRKHYLAISAPAVPMPPELPLPGPGAYELRDFKEPNKKYMSSAVFVSSTGRWNGAGGGGVGGAGEAASNPGPASYNPAKLLKQSFHYNLTKRWI